MSSLQICMEKLLKCLPDFRLIQNMKAIWQRIGKVMLLGSGLLSGSFAVCAAEISAVRIWASPDYTRAVFDVSGPVDYRLFQIANPDRIVLDIRGSVPVDSLGIVNGKGLVKSVRTGKQGKGDVRMVFDLLGAAQPKSFLLPPAENVGYRLVVDLYPKQKSALAASKSVAQTNNGRVRNVIVMIDPGHGGEDPGASGASGTHEKSITLSVSRELKQMIDKQPGMSAVLTRDSDYFVPLEERYKKAREAKADLFISVHADAFSSSDAHGSSVWVLSSRGATNQAARWLADRENRSDLVGGVSIDNKDQTLAAVLLDLQQGATLEASSNIAENVLRALAKIGTTHRGYIERANFVVLRSPDVPSILVETAFISNPSEEKRLNSPGEREKLASAILDGVRDYFRATPPPGTLFAANAIRQKIGQHIAARSDIMAAVPE